MKAREDTVEVVLRSLTRWANNHEDVCAAALVGSWARGTARMESDIDVMFLVNNPSQFRLEERWVNEIDWPNTLKICSWEDKTYGVVWSRHILLKADLDDAPLVAELSFGLHSWADVNPIDAGTRQVMSGGCRILYESDNQLTLLVDKLG